MTTRHRLSPAIAAILFAGVLSAQESVPASAATPPAVVTPAPADASAPILRLGDKIINLPSPEVPAAGTLSMLFTHRFSEALEDSDIHSLYSFDSGAEIGIGLGYTPVKHLQVSVYRSSRLDDYEADLKWQVVSGGFGLALRGGGGWRTERNVQYRSGFFAQAILGVSIGPRIRVTVVPTYVSRYGGERFVAPKPLYENIYNFPAALSIAVTRSIYLNGEIVPRNGRADSTGVGWMASIEKTVPRHRFSFTVGNLRGTTVSQYVGSTFSGLPPKNYFIGFNLARSWKL
ncbi:MAG: DUF5777 family beta-barrel protein [Acidobacteriota bacterium]